MKRVVIAAFEQGIYDRETVRDRMAYMRRGDPDADVLFPTSNNSGVPQYFDKLGKPGAMDNFSLETNRTKTGLRVDTNLLPLSAQVQTASGADGELQPHPHLASLPLEKQLALLFDASRSVEERVRRKRENRQPIVTVQVDEEPELVLSVLITMPRPRQSINGENGNLALGTTVYPWQYEVAEVPHTTSSPTIVSLSIDDSNRDALSAPTRI